MYVDHKYNIHKAIKKDPMNVYLCERMEQQKSKSVYT